MSTNNIGMNNISKEQKSTCTSVTKKIVIDDRIAGRLRFKSGEQLKNYMKKNGIDESNFENETELLDYLLEYLIDDESDAWHHLSYGLY